jgi:hypothetical protein
MALTCLIGLHKWDGCICTSCGKIKKDNHNWDGCKCTKCQTVRDTGHSWAKDASSGCSKCSKCGKTRTQHHFQDDKCIYCGKLSGKSLLIEGITNGVKDNVLQALSDGVDVNIEIAFQARPGSMSGFAIGGLLEGLVTYKTPLQIALENGFFEIAEILLKKGAKLKALYDGDNPWDNILLNAAKSNQVEICKLALKQGADINSRGLHSTTPLMFASMFGHCATVSFLLSKGAGINAYCTDPYNPGRRFRTALMWAQAEGKNEVINILIENGAKE